MYFVLLDLLRKQSLLREDRQGSSSGDLLNGFGDQTVFDDPRCTGHNFNDCSPALVTEVVAGSAMSPLGVTFVPDHDE